MAEALYFVTASGAGQLVAVVAGVVLAETEPEDGEARGCSCGEACSGVVAACLDGGKMDMMVMVILLVSVSSWWWFTGY